MTQVDFYIHVADKLQTLCTLAAKALARKVRVLVLTPDPQTTEQVDKRGHGVRRGEHEVANARVEEKPHPSDGLAQTGVSERASWQSRPARPSRRCGRGAP